jgi:hypothetical protein
MSYTKYLKRVSILGLGLTLFISPASALAQTTNVQTQISAIVEQLDQIQASLAQLQFAGTGGNSISTILNSTSTQAIASTPCLPVDYDASNPLSFFNLKSCPNLAPGGLLVPLFVASTTATPSTFTVTPTPLTITAVSPTSGPAPLTVTINTSAEPAGDSVFVDYGDYPAGFGWARSVCTTFECQEGIGPKIFEHTYTSPGTYVITTGIPHFWQCPNGEIACAVPPATPLETYQVTQAISVTVASGTPQ